MSVFVETKQHAAAKTAQDPRIHASYATHLQQQHQHGVCTPCHRSWASSTAVCGYVLCVIGPKLCQMQGTLTQVVAQDLLGPHGVGP